MPYMIVFVDFLQRQMKELMVRAIYCEMLGYEASFSYIHAIKLAQQGTALEKRVGMFFCCELEELTRSSASSPNGSQMFFKYVMFLRNFLHFLTTALLNHETASLHFPVLLICRLSCCVFVSERKSWAAPSPREHCIKGGCSFFIAFVIWYLRKGCWCILCFFVVFFFFFTGSSEHEPHRSVHGFNCRKPNVPQRHDSCNPSSGWRET